MANQNDLETSLDKEETVVDTETEQVEEETTDEPSSTELMARLKRAESKIERMKLNQQVDKKVEKYIEKKASELDETHLAYLELKGIAEPEDIKIIERHVARTGETVREALKDEYVMAKLDANKSTREVKGAMPSSTKRPTAGQTNDIALAIAKFEQTGRLPDDFALASAVTNAIEQKSNSNKPAWH